MAAPQNNEPIQPPQKTMTREERKRLKQLKPEQNVHRALELGNEPSPAFNVAHRAVKQERQLKVKQVMNAMQVPQIDEKVGGALYMPVTDENKEYVFEQIVHSMDNMSDLDYEVSERQESKHVYSVKYGMAQFVLSRVRLVEIDEELHIELRKLEGDGFQFTDSFYKELQTSLAHVTGPSEENAYPENQPDPEYMYMDLEDEMSQEILEYWLGAFKPQEGFRYDEVQLLSTLSAMAFNMQDPSNLGVLVGHADDIVDSLLGILAQTQRLALTYFGCVVVNAFTKAEAVEADWATVGRLCQILQKWSNPNAVDNLADQQISRSRESVCVLLEAITLLCQRIDSESTIVDVARQTVDQLREFSQLCQNRFDLDEVAALLQVA